MRIGELGKRFGVAGITIPIIFAAILYGKIGFLALVTLIVVLALWELYGIAQKKQFHPSKVLGIIGVTAITWDLYFTRGQWLLEILLVLFFIMLLVELFKGKPYALANISITVFGIFYIALFSSFILIRELPAQMNLDYSIGGYLVIMVFSTIWICDTGAYLWGRKFGKHPFYKRVSPKKTWEGAWAGLITGIISAVGLRFIFVPTISIFDSVMIGLIVGVFGQLGDLFESLLKRDADVKDSSNILPGHGGFLDRFDSPLFVGPLVYIYLKWFGF